MPRKHYRLYNRLGKGYKTTTKKWKVLKHYGPFAPLVYYLEFKMPFPKPKKHKR